MDKTTGNWEQEEWEALKFGSDSPILYRYSTVASGVSTSAAFTAVAEGNIDGDLSTSLFERVGSVNATTGEVEGGAGLFVSNDLE